MNVISFGEIVWDIYPDNACLGGAPLNFAAHLARHGHEVYMLSAVGTDAYGDQALSHLQEWNIRTDCVARLPDKQTGACLVTLNEAGVPQYNLLDDVAYDHIPLTAVPEADALYFGTLALRSDSNRRTLRKLLDEHRFSDVFVDINIRAPFYSEDTVRFAVQHATVLKISDEEMPTVAGLLKMTASEPLLFLEEMAAVAPSVQCLILTCGAQGAYVYHRADNAVSFCESKPVKVVSTVGAGDSFSAAFMHKYRQNEPIARCAAYASAVAGFVVSNQAAVPPYSPQDITE